MDTAAIKEYTESAKSVIDNSPQLDEANTKAAILQDFIEILGWEIPKNTELEFSVKALGKVHKVDYALKIGGQPVAFLEAKGLDNSLTDDHREKIGDYLRNENVELGILTNGRQYEFYQLRIHDPEVPIDLVESTNLENLPRKQSIIEAYRTENIREQKSGDIIQNIRQLRSAHNALRENKDNIAKDVTELLTGSTSVVIESEAETQAKEMVDRLISDVESKVIADTPNKREDTTHNTDGESDKRHKDTYSAKIIKNGSTIKEFDTDSQSDLMVNIANYLIDNHGLISNIEPLPYIPGKKRAIVNKSTEYEGGEMDRPRELVGGYYIEIKMSWIQKKREIIRLADICDLECEFERYEAQTD